MSKHISIKKQNTINSTILHTYFLDEYYISKPLFFGYKPDYKIKIKNIILSTISGLYSHSNTYYLLYDIGIDKKTNKWSDGKIIRSKLPKKISDFSSKLVDMLFTRNHNNQFFELELYSEEEVLVYSWSFGDYVHLKINEKNFKEFQYSLSKHSLPTNLYYKSGQEIIAYPLGKKPLNILRRLLHLKKKYSPKQWEEHVETHSTKTTP